MIRAMTIIVLLTVCLTCGAVRAEPNIPPGYTIEPYVTGLQNVSAIAFSPGGDFGYEEQLFVGDSRPNPGTIYRVPSKGNKIFFAHSFDDEPRSFEFAPVGSAFASGLYVTQADSIQRYDSTGASTQFASIHPLGWDLAFAADQRFRNNLFHADGWESAGEAIREWTPDGSQTELIGSLPEETSGLAFGPGGPFGKDLYVAFSKPPGSHHTMCRVSPDGVMRDFVIWLPFTQTNQLAFDTTGNFRRNLFVSEFGHGVIFEIDPTGAVSVFADGFSFSSTPHHPGAGGDLVFGPDGALYVADGGVGVVWRIASEYEFQDVYYTDALNGDDDNNGRSPETAFATIQKGIDTAEDGDRVLVYPGLYTEEIDFLGKAVTVQGLAGPAGAAVLQNPDDFAVSFHSGEGRDSILKNFVIRGSFVAVFIAGSSPTLSNLTVVANKSGIEAYAGSEPDISNCIFWSNTDSDLFGCQAGYSWVQQDIEPGPQEGLISHWKLDEGSGATAHDSVGENHGTIYGAQWTNGQIDGALGFDGDGDYVMVGDKDSLEPQQLTLSFWAKLNHPLDTIEGGVGKGRMCSPSGYSYRLTFGGLWAYATMSPRPSDSISTNTFMEETGWHMWSMTVGNDQLCLYKDGLLEDSAEFTEPICYTQTHNNFVIGGREDGHCTLNGKLDDVRVYGRALSAEEIQQLYQDGLRGGKFSPDPLFADANDGDYHLLSERGRYWPEHDIWVLDKVTSPCVDGGDPSADPSDERRPNGGRANMGVYGGTAYASMNQWWPPGDFNHDGMVNMMDLALLSQNWLESEPAPSNYPPAVNITNPPDEVGFADCTMIEIEAEARDPDGSVVKVEFFVDGSKVGEEIGKVGQDLNGADGWRVTWLWWGHWAHYPAGKYRLTAKATDNHGATKISPVVDIYVSGPPVLPPPPSRQ